MLTCQYHCKGKPCEHMKEINGKEVCIISTCPFYQTFMETCFEHKEQSKPTSRSVLTIVKHRLNVTKALNRAYTAGIAWNIREIKRSYEQTLELFWYQNEQLDKRLYAYIV